MKKTLALLLLLAGLTLDAQAETLTWNGYEDHMTWNTEDTNWSQGGTSAQYTNGYDVVFGDNGIGRVSLSGALAPARMLVYTDKDYYTFDSADGSGKLTGTMQLTKDGEGLCIFHFSGGNDYTGGTVIKGGRLLMGGDNAFGSGAVTLYGGTLDLGGFTLPNQIIVAGTSAAVGDGTIAKQLIVEQGQRVTLLKRTFITDHIYLKDKATLDLGGNTFNVASGVGKPDIPAIEIDGLASIDNGTLTLDKNTVFSLHGNIKGTGIFSLGTGAELRLNDYSLSNPVLLSKDSIIEAGPFPESFFITPREGEDSTVLENMTVSYRLIAGTDRQTSLADGLKIVSGADLMIKSMTITANNEIYVGKHTITLNQVTIDLSQAKYELVGSDYYFQLQDLINCKLEMDDVVFDASGLELPTGFDPGVNGIGIDFGTDVTIDPQTARNLTLLMGGDWSQTMNLADGKPVFTALVPTPEPATGTLSLLALAGLAARRRRK